MELCLEIDMNNKISNLEYIQYENNICSASTTHLPISRFYNSIFLRSQTIKRRMRKI